MKAHAVRRLDLFVTERCNLACEYCFAASQPQPDLPEDRLLRAVDWLLRSEADRLHVTLWGGEPLLRFDGLRRIVAHGREQADRLHKTLSFSLPTNASLIREDILTWLAEERIETFLSIDGDELGQRARPLRAGGSSHRLVSAGMRRALARPAATPAIRMTVSPHNARRLADNVRYFVERGAHRILIYAASDHPWRPQELDAYGQGQLDLAAWLVTRLTSDGESGQLPALPAWLPILRRLLDEPPPREREGPLRHCGVGSDLVAFGVDQRLWPCHRFLFYGRDRGRDLTLGSTADGIDPAAAARYGELRIEQMRGTERCVDCAEFDLCTHGCLAVNYAGTGEISEVPAAACALMRAQIRACRHVHEALRDDPAYALYLGSSVRRTLSHAADKLGARAFADYQHRCTAQPYEGEEDEQASR